MKFEDLTEITVTDLTPTEVDDLIAALEIAWQSEDGPAKPAAVWEIYYAVVLGKWFPGKSLQHWDPCLLNSLWEVKSQ